MVISDKLLALANEAEIALREKFDYFDKISFKNTKKVLNAFS